MEPGLRCAGRCGETGEEIGREHRILNKECRITKYFGSQILRSFGCAQDRFAEHDKAKDMRKNLIFFAHFEGEITLYNRN